MKTDREGRSEGAHGEKRRTRRTAQLKKCYRAGGAAGMAEAGIRLPGKGAAGRGPVNAFHKNQA